MVIGISIDGVLRNFIDKFSKVYTKYTGEEAVLPVTGSTLINHFPFSGGTDEMLSFLYEECSLEVFGYANETYRNVMLDLAHIIKTNPEHDFILINREIGRSIPATLFFLSKTNCMVENIKFVKSHTDVWNFVNVMITANPEIIESKPENKIVVRLETEYNQDLKGDYSFERLSDLREFEILLEEKDNHE